MLHCIDCIRLLATRLPPSRPCTASTQYRCRQAHAQLLRQHSASRQSLEAHLVPRPATLLHHHQHSAHITLTSNFSFSTSFAAISAGVPVSISVFFCFSGRYTRSSETAFPPAAAAAGIVFVS